MRFGISCPKNYCCSKDGYCGLSEKHCKISNGCQRKYGKCDSVTKTFKSTTTTTTTELPTTTTINVPTTTNNVDEKSLYNKCGPKYGNRICSGNKCCNESGECGFNLDFCGKGCQSEFGYCLPKQKLENPVCSDCKKCTGCSDCHKCTNPDDRLLCPKVCIDQQNELDIEPCGSDDIILEKIDAIKLCKDCQQCIDCTLHPIVGELLPSACKRMSNIISKDGKCGPKYGNKICPNNECCDENDQCGFSLIHCQNKGCQPGYGLCIKPDIYICDACMECSDCDYNPVDALNCPSSCYMLRQPPNESDIPKDNEYCKKTSNLCYKINTVYYSDYLTVYQKQN
ncbi:hypothetical protein PIROE2DRAFT_14182 [Piromyces sp. E2]|nr:hypothetical protein PIROE2DRAFT_14182 [Piromyces sp. E2]|eukprot:OUM60123.1 hypothetical protein PIROE2DRAFT_14182 [Piromyces sp. E2]